MVREEFWEVEEFWNQLFDVRHVSLGRGQPCVFYGMEQAVGKIEIPLGRGQGEGLVLNKRNEQRNDVQ